MTHSVARAYRVSEPFHLLGLAKSRRRCHGGNGRFADLVGKLDRSTADSYLSLGLVNEAQTAGAILGYNYQSSEWYEDTYRLLTARGLELKDRGNNWLSQIYRQSIKGQWL